MRGKLLVIEGGDGSGKTTQAKMLVDFFHAQQMPTHYYDFPQYEQFYGKLIARYLRGEFGDIHQVSPYLACLPFALDRASVSNEMHQYLQKGYFLVANRYAPSNMAHQSSRISSKTEKIEFLRFIMTLEYQENKIPKEDLVFYLNVPWQTGMALTQKKGARPYLNGKNDILETSSEYRQLTEKAYLDLAEKYTHWITIDSFEDKRLLSPDVIHQKIVSVLRKQNVIP